MAFMPPCCAVRVPEGAHQQTVLLEQLTPSDGPPINGGRVDKYLMIFPADSDLLLDPRIGSGSRGNPRAPMPFSSKTRLLYLYLREGQRRLARLLSRGMTTALRFAGSTPARLIVAPTDLRAIDPFAAEEILAGRFPLAGRVLDTEGESPFEIDLPSQEFAARLHSFGWLRHMRAIQDEAGAIRLRQIMDDWMAAMAEASAKSRGKRMWLRNASSPGCPIRRWCCERRARFLSPLPEKPCPSGPLSPECRRDRVRWRGAPEGSPGTRHGLRFDAGYGFGDPQGVAQSGSGAGAAASARRGAFLPKPPRRARAAARSAAAAPDLCQSRTRRALEAHSLHRPYVSGAPLLPPPERGARPFQRRDIGSRP